MHLTCTILRNASRLCAVRRAAINLDISCRPRPCRDRQTDGRTPDRCIDSARHTMHAVPTSATSTYHSGNKLYFSTAGPCVDSLYALTFLFRLSCVTRLLSSLFPLVTSNFSPTNHDSDKLNQTAKYPGQIPPSEKSFCTDTHIPVHKHPTDCCTRTN